MSDPLLQKLIGGPETGGDDPLLQKLTAPADPLLERLAAPADPVFGDPSVTGKLTKAAEVARDARWATGRGEIRDLASDLRKRFPDASYESQQARSKAEYALRDLKSAAKLEPMVENMAERSGVPEVEEKVTDTLDDSEDYWRNWRGKSALEGSAKVLDTALGGSSVRALADPTLPVTEFSPSKVLQLEQAPTGAELMDRWEQARDEKGLFDDTLGPTAARVLRTIEPTSITASLVSDPYGTMHDAFENVDKVLGYAIGVPYEGAKANARLARRGWQEAKEAVGMGPQLSDLVTGKAPEKEGVGEILVDWWKGMQEPAPVHGMAAEIGLDPSNLLSFGTKGAAQQAYKQTIRALRGVELATDAKVVAREVAEAVAKHGGDVGLKEAIDAIVTKYDLPAEEIARVFGQNHDWLGRSGGAVAGIDVTDALDQGLRAVTKGRVRAPEQAIRRVVGAPVDALRNPVTREMGWHAREGLKRRAAEARNLAKAGAETKMGDAFDQLAHLMPEDPKRAEQLILEHMDPDPNTVPGAMTETEKQFITGWDRLFTEWGDELQQAGVIDGLKFNEATGLYVPRFYSPRGARSFLEQLLGSKGFTPVREASSAASRTSDVALGTNALREGADAMSAVHHPAELVTRYVPKMERKIQLANFRKWAADAFGEPLENAPASKLNLKNEFEEIDGKLVPRPVLAAVEKEFDRAFNSMMSNVMDRFIKSFKTVTTLPVPRYHITNMSGDLMMMWAGGFKSPGAFKQASQVLGKTNPDVVVVKGPVKNWTAGELREIGRRAGITSGQIGSAEVDLMEGAGRIQSRFERAARTGAAERGETVTPASQFYARQAAKMPGEVAATAGSLGMNKAGEKVARAWDSRSKMAFLIDRLEKGDSVNIALKRTFEALYDYGDQDRLLRAIRKFVPFATWQYKSAVNVPKALVRRPGAGLTSERLVSGLGAQEGDIRDESPEWASEMRRNLPAPAPFREDVSALQDAAGAGQMHPGYGLNVGIREPFSEAMAPWLEGIVNNNWDPFALMMGPQYQAGLEVLTEQDRLTKRPLNPGEFGDVLPWGVGPEALQAESPDETSWSRYLPQMVASAPLMLAANSALGGEVLGRHRERTALTDQKDFLRLMNLLLGLPMHTTTPSDALQNRAESGEVKEAIQNRLGLKKAAKERRAILDR